MIRHIATIPTVVPSVVPSRRPTSAPSGGVRSRLIASYITESLGNLPTTSRATVSPMYADASGDLVQYAANNVALVNGDSVACWPGFTNLSSFSEELDRATWNKTRASVSTNAIAAPDGATTADKLVEDSTASNTHFIAHDVITTTGSASINLSVYAKAAERSAFRIRLSAGGTIYNAWVDASDGSVGDTTGSPTVTSELVKGFYRFSITGTAGVGTSTDYQFYMATGTTSGDETYNGDGSSGIYLWGAQLTESSYLLPYVPTAGSSVAVDASEPYVALPALTENFAGQLRWTPSVDDQGTVWLLGNYTDANNAWGILHDGTNIIFRNRVSGSNNDATKALNYSPDTEYLIQWKHSATNGLDIAVDRVSGTNDSTTTSVTNATNTYIGQDGNDASHMIGSVNDLRHIKVAANISTAEWLAL